MAGRKRTLGGRNKLISRAYSRRPCGFRFEIVNSPDVDRSPTGELSNFHRIERRPLTRETRPTPDTEMKLVTQAKPRGQKSRELQQRRTNFSCNFLPPRRWRTLTSLTTCVHASDDVYCTFLCTSGSGLSTEY